MEAGADDFIQGQRLLIDSRLDEAEACFRRAVDQGYAGGLMGLASVENQRGNLSAAQALIESLEARAGAGEALANFYCYFAYTGYLTAGTADQKQRKANTYLLAAAELGDPAAQVILAQHLHDGSNGREKDHASYEHWIARAVDQDYEDAIIACAWNALADKRPIPDALLDKLRRFADSSSACRKILSRLPRA
jgi:TPR repeat protein